MSIANHIVNIYKNTHSCNQVSRCLTSCFLTAKPIALLEPTTITYGATRDSFARMHSGTCLASREAIANCFALVNPT
jgi:hypothetical protein